MFAYQLCNGREPVAQCARNISLPSLFLEAYVLPGDRAAAARAFFEASPDASADALAALEERRAALQAERLQVKKELRNESRKRKRLLTRAKGLSEEELVSVMIMKAQAKAKASAKAKSDASSRYAVKARTHSSALPPFMPLHLRILCSPFAHGRNP